VKTGLARFLIGYIAGGAQPSVNPAAPLATYTSGELALPARQRVDQGRERCAIREIEGLDEAYAMAKLRPAETGLPMAVWVTENEGFRHDVRVNVSRVHGGRGAWSGAASVAVRPTPRLFIGHLDPADLRLVSQWIELTRTVIIDYWDGAVSLTELLAGLQRLP
jgi:hypothetical protein